MGEEGKGFVFSKYIQKVRGRTAGGKQADGGFDVGGGDRCRAVIQERILR